MKTNPNPHLIANPPSQPAAEDNDIPRDRPVNPNPLADGTRFQGVQYPDDSDGEPDGESAAGREDAEAARRDQEKIGTPAASP